MSNSTEPVIGDLHIFSKPHANFLEQEQILDAVTYETKSLDYMSHRTFKDTLED